MWILKACCFLNFIHIIYRNIIESRNKEVSIIDFEIFKSFLFASAQIATKKCNCTHTLKSYLTVRGGGLESSIMAQYWIYSFSFFTNTCFLKKADINAHSGRFDKLFVSTQHAPFPFFERNKIRYFFQANWIIRNVLNTRK